MAGCANANTPATPVEEPNSTETTGLDRNDTSNYVGTWECPGMRFVINRGGVGVYYTDGYTDMSGNEQRGSTVNFNWEVKDGVLVIEDSAVYGLQGKSVFELTEDGSALSVIQFGTLFRVGNPSQLEKTTSP